MAKQEILNWVSLRENKKGKLFSEEKRRG